MAEAETWQTASAGAVVNYATADAALRFWAFFHTMLDGQPDACPVPPVGDLMRLIHSRIVGLVLLLPGSSIEGHAHKSYSWGHTNIARIPSTAACRQLLAEPQPRIGGMVDQRLDLCLPGRGFVRGSQTAGTNRTSPVCGPHGSLCVGTHQQHLPPANLGTAFYDFRPESDNDSRPGRGVVLRLGGHGALLAGPGRAAAMCKLLIRIPASAGQLTLHCRLLSDTREFAADGDRTLGMRGLRIARLAAGGSTTDSAAAAGAIDTVVVTGDTAHRDYLADATSSAGGGDGSMSVSASTRTGSAVVLPPGDYEIRFEMLCHSRAHSHGEVTKAPREAVPPSCWLEMLLRDEARSQACSLNNDIGASAEHRGLSVDKQPLSLAEAAVAPCIEFAVIKEGEEEEKEPKGDAKNDDPGLLTAQPHLVSDEARDAIWPMSEISGSPQHCVGDERPASA